MNFDPRIQLSTYHPILKHNVGSRKRRSSEITSSGSDLLLMSSPDMNLRQHQQVLAGNALRSSITLPIVGDKIDGSGLDGLQTVVRAADQLARSDHAVSDLRGQATAASSAAGSALPRTGPAAAPSSGPGVVQSTRRTNDNKKMISSPQEFFASMLQARGYPAVMLSSLKCGYHNSPTKHQMASYGVALTRAVRSSDSAGARALLSAGLHPNACNKFGESIVHAACRRGDHAMLRALLAAGSSVQVTDDFGRTPLHDACWTSSPNFDAIRCLLDEDPWLLCVMDCRGSTPLGYVRKAHWGVWIGFLGGIADRYWPALNRAPGEQHVPTNQGGDQPGGDDDGRRVPPLARVEPNTRPLPDPKSVLELDVVELLANGKLAPEDLDDDGAPLPAKSSTPEEVGLSSSQSVAPCSRITLDPLRTSGSNATTMLRGTAAGAVAAPGAAPPRDDRLRQSGSNSTIISKDSQGAASTTTGLLNGYVQVEATTVLDCT